jgi:putative ABC transport system permease protein
VIEPRTILVALLVGFGVTLLATIVPALRASRIPPVAAMRPELASVERGGHRRRITGVVMLLLGAALYGYGILGHPGSTVKIILFAAVGAVLVFLGVTMLASSIASVVSRVLGAPIAKMFGIPGDLARQNAARSPRRTSSTAAALMIGVALVSAVGVIASSLKDSLSDQLGSSIKADFFFTDESFQGFSSDFVDRLSELPELSGVSGVRTGSFQIDGGERAVAAIDTAGFADIVDVDVKSGGYDGLADGGVMVHKDPAKDLKLKVGDTVDVTWKNGNTQTLTVRGIFNDASITNTNWMVDMATFEAGNPSVKNDLFAGARIKDGVEIEAARTAIEKVAADFPQVKVQDQAEFRKSQEDQLNQLLTVIYGLLFFAVIIAILGIMNTLALSVFERTREFGLIRAVGATQRQLKRAVRWEAVIVSVFGALLGLVVGLPLGIVATKGMDSLGVKSASLPVGTIIAILVAAVLAGILAAIWPARRAAKLNVLEAIATE